MSSHPTVKDLVKLGGGKTKQPASSLILPMAEAILLHEIILASPPAGEGLQLLTSDARLPLLRDHGLAQQNAAGRWVATADGVKHMMPTRKPSRQARRVADSLLRKVNDEVVDGLIRREKLN